jgi:uncharacterized protein YebE (UPF0316 family)
MAPIPLKSRRNAGEMSASVKHPSVFSKPTDQSEQEADRVAKQVMAMPAPGVESTSPPTPRSRRPRLHGSAEINRKSRQCTSGSLVQSRVNPVGTANAKRLKTTGKALSPSQRNFFEPRFGHDFSRVRIYADHQAASLASRNQAEAFASGRDIIFGAGKYRPWSNQGGHLLAHELTHIAQNGLAPRLPLFDAVPIGKRLQSGTIARAVSPQYAAINRNLTYGIVDWAITDTEAREVLEILSGLSDVDLEDTIRRMETDGLVVRLIDNISESDKISFGAVIQKIQGVRSTSLVTAQIEDLMSYGILDWAITEAEAHRALESLKGLRLYPIKLKQVLRLIDEKYFRRFFEELSENDKESNKEFLAELNSIRATGMTRQDAYKPFMAYKILPPSDRRKQFDADYPTGRISNMLRALSPKDAVDTFENEVRELLRWLQEAETRAMSGMSEEEMAKLQSEFMEARLQKRAIAKIEKEAAKKGEPKSTTPIKPTAAQRRKAHEEIVGETTVKQKSEAEIEWLKKKKAEKLKWEKRGKAVIASVLAHVQKEYPELKLTAANFKADYEGIERRGKHVYAMGGTGSGGERLCVFGRSFVEVAEANPAYVVHTVVHEVFGHPEYGTYGQEYLLKLYDQAAAKIKDYVRPTGKKRGAEIDNFAYQGTEIYSELRSLPYYTPVSAKDRAKKIGGGGSPQRDVLYRVGLIKQNWHSKLAPALIRGLYMRFRNDPRLTPEALKLFRDSVKRVFKKEAKSILK